MLMRKVKSLVSVFVVCISWDGSFDSSTSKIATDSTVIYWIFLLFVFLKKFCGQMLSNEGAAD